MAAFNVHRYLPDFTQSLERQTLDASDFEVIFVDDGSTDDTYPWLQQWCAATRLNARVQTQQNAGQGAARNAGMKSANATWITFPDPDDWLEHNYLEAVARRLDQEPDLSMVATNRVMFHESAGVIRENHPLARFFYRDHTVDLGRRPDYFHGSAPSSFVRLEEVREWGLEFDTRIRANFEDGLFNASYLLHSRQPTVAFLKSARYYYRKRADSSSTLQSMNSSEDRFTSSVEFGFLGALRLAQELGHKSAPIWLQNAVLYELSWYFQQDSSFTSGTAVSPHTLEIFRRHLKDICDLLDHDVIDSFSLRRFDGPWRIALKYGFSELDWHSDEVVVEQLDEKRKMLRLAYRFVGEEPVFHYQSAGQDVAPLHTKIRTFEYFGSPLVYERIVWLSSRHNVSVWHNGRRVALAPDWPRAVRVEYTPKQVARRFGVPKSPVGAVNKPRKKALLDRATVAIGRSRVARHFLRRAWVLMDRPQDAEDSGEVLYHYLRENRPDLNAWFVICRDAPAYKRLRRRDRKVVRYGSRLWLILLMNAEFVISSHADDAVAKPARYRQVVGRQPWRFIFLQHGVIKDDLSRYTNTKDIALLITSTPAEHESIVGDYTNYRNTTADVALTGLPRFDALRQMADANPHSDGKYITLAPTWRRWLEKAAKDTTDSEGLQKFESSDYAQHWLRLIRSPELRDLANEAGLQVALLPHPNLRRALFALGVPDHITMLDFEDGMAQKNFADTAVLVTDYSSMSFNAAFLKRPVVYYQFDRERFMNGGHTSRPGYYSYERHGFGPVVERAGDMIAAVARALDLDDPATAMYQARAAETFAFDDTQASARVTDAILNLRKAIPSPLPEFAPRSEN